jgi:MoaA/NifB/PqqE/SkfB family radical SAM enzyme
VSGRKIKLRQRLLLFVKDLLWQAIPQKLGNKMANFYWQHKKFKKQDYIVLHIFLTGKCNLNCISCSTFAPIADADMLNIVSFESDCKRLSELGGEKVPEIHFLGGEPLLHSQLIEVLGIARSYFPYAKFKIITNGTLLLKQTESFWDCCRSNSVDIVISHYPIKLDMKNIKAMIKKYGLNLRYYHGILPWYKLAFDLNGKYNPVENYKKCSAALACVELRNGRIATCQVIQKVKYFNNYFHRNLEVLDTDTMDIYKAKSMDEILDFISKPVSFCRYCKVKWIPIKWDKSKRDVSEWT